MSPKSQYYSWYEYKAYLYKAISIAVVITRASYEVVAEHLQLYIYVDFVTIHLLEKSNLSLNYYYQESLELYIFPSLL